MKADDLRGTSYDSFLEDEKQAQTIHNELVDLVFSITTWECRQATRRGDTQVYIAPCQIHTECCRLFWTKCIFPISEKYYLPKVMEEVIRDLEEDGYFVYSDWGYGWVISWGEHPIRSFFRRLTKGGHRQ